MSTSLVADYTAKRGTVGLACVDCADNIRDSRRGADAIGAGSIGCPLELEELFITTEVGKVRIQPAASSALVEAPEYCRTTEWDGLCPRTRTATTDDGA